MDASTALHTAARRYCLEHGARADRPDVHLIRQLAPEKRETPSRAYIWPIDPPRAVVGAILTAVERLTPRTEPSRSDLHETPPITVPVEDLRAQLVALAQTVEVYPAPIPHQWHPGTREPPPA